MNTYTVLYTCVRGYKCFRQVQAKSPADVQLVMATLPPRNAGAVTDIRPAL